MVIHIHINGKLHRINNCVFFYFHVKLLILLALATLLEFENMKI